MPPTFLLERRRNQTTTVMKNGREVKRGIYTHIEAHVAICLDTNRLAIFYDQFEFFHVHSKTIALHM